MNDLNSTPTKNSQVTDSKEQNLFHPSRIISNVIVSCMFTLTLWITISLIHYVIKTGKWRQLKKQNSTDSLSIGHTYASAVLCGLLDLFYDTVASTLVSQAPAITNVMIVIYFPILQSVFTE